MVEIVLATIAAGSVIAGLGMASMRAEARKNNAVKSKEEAAIPKINAVSNSISASPASNNAIGDWNAPLINQELAASTRTFGH